MKQTGETVDNDDDDNDKDVQSPCTATGRLLLVLYDYRRHAVEKQKEEACRKRDSRTFLSQEGLGIDID